MTDSKRMLLPQPLVASLLSGATAVSLPVKPQPWYVSNWHDDLPAGFVVDKDNGYWRWGYGCWPENRCMTGDVAVFAERLAVRCPFSIGTEVWVPETWQYYDWTEEGIPFIRYQTDGASLIREDVPDDWMDRVEDVWATLSDPANYGVDNRASDRRWRPAITMPSWAARLRYIIDGVRVGRAQDTTDEQAIFEGVGLGWMMNGGWPDYQHVNEHGHCELTQDTILASYATLWNAAYPDYPWGSNPWRYTYTLRRQ